MFRPAKTRVGSLLRKTLAFTVTYSFVAVSSWGLVLLSDGLPVSRLAPGALVHSGAIASINHSAMRSLSGAASSAPMMVAQAGGAATTTIGIFGPQQYVRTT